MKILQVDLSKDYSEAIREAVSVLSSGGVIIYPTDTLYGLGANALDEKAVERVFEIKKRPLSKPLPVAVKNIIWAKGLAHVSRKNTEVLENIWPGKATAILPKRDIVPVIVTAGSSTIGIRVADYSFVNKLLGRFGYPLTSTSANISGEEPTNDINKIIECFGKSSVQPDLVIDVGILPKSDPSLVVDLTASKPKILRIGPSKPDQFLKLLNLR